MDNPTHLRFLTEDFRSIEHADITIEGITLVAGENGCGKSTLSKLLYYLYKTISDYDYLVATKLSRDLGNVERFLEIAQIELFNKKYNRSRRVDFKNEFTNLRHNLIMNSITESSLLDWLNFVEKLEISISLEGLMNDESKQRLNYIARDVIKRMDVKLKESDDSPFALVKKYIQSLFKEAFGILDSRSTTIFRNELANVFHDSELPKRFEVYEFGQQIISLNKNYLSIPYTIQDVIYIDTPMMLGVETFDNSHWDDLNEIVKRKNTNSFSELSKIISNEIIDGEAVFEDGFLSINEFLYRRSDGSVFNLLDCATGIKSFSIIQLLLKNGSLSDKTLFIMDEPESHLHPQWIIEYARLIVLLNKHVGVKFFIASHNPDMVSAIKIIAEKENVIDDTNFYLAQRFSKHQYKFKNLGKEIDPIFASFNIAFDRMHLYGGE